MVENLPNTFVIGAGKAGTTTLCDTLRRHPEAYVPVEKEPAFFSDDRKYERGLGWYAAMYYSRAAKFPVRIDGSTAYLFWGEKVAPRIKDAYGDANPRFIALFRDPVHRAYAWYWMRVSAGREPLSFEEALRAEPERSANPRRAILRLSGQSFNYFRGGCYATSLRPFMDLFPRERFKFFLFEDLRSNFQGTMDGVLDFLQIEQRRAKQIRSNPSAKPISRPLMDYLRKTTGIPGFLRWLVYQRLSPEARHAFKMRIWPIILRPTAYPPMDPRLEAELRARYAEEVKALAPMIDRDLSSWLPR